MNGVSSEHLAMCYCRGLGGRREEKEVLGEQIQKLTGKGKRRKKPAGSAGVSEVVMESAELVMERRYVSLEEAETAGRLAAGCAA
jgi:hypothetical protein